jgi:hypothetical protein
MTSAIPNLTCREWHYECHSVRMRKLLTWYFVSVQRLLCRGEVSGRSNGGRPRAGWSSATDVRATAFWVKESRA